MHSKLLAAALAASISLNASAAAAPDAPIIIKFSHTLPLDTPKGQAAERFKYTAEKLTKGRVRIEVYANSQLYKDKDELDALQQGTVQMLVPALGKLANTGVTEFELFELPYLFPSRQALYSVTEGPIGKGLLARLEPKGIVGLAYWDNGFKVMTSNKVLHGPADFKGLKMRVQSTSAVLDAEMRTLGAIPYVTNTAEVYQALKNGTVDGAENPPSNMYYQKAYEVQKNMTLTNHSYLGYAVIANKKFWDGLPPDVRVALETALRDATAYEKAISQVDNDRTLDAIKASGKTAVYTPTAAEDAALRQALVPVQKQMENRIGKDLLTSISKVAK